MAETGVPALVPELLVADLDRSLEFWCQLCGFTVRYRRAAEGFAYIALGPAHLMLEQYGVGRNWVSGPLQAPLGRGINFQITVPRLAPIAHALTSAGVELFMQPERRRYLVGDDTVEVDQFLVQDPDGYLLRFQSQAAPSSSGPIANEERPVTSSESA